MKAKLLKLRDDILNSYWFIPAIMTFCAVILAIVLTEYHDMVTFRWLTSVHWLNVNEPSGARAVLSTIAGSMITVAGVTFSITIAAISYASGQFGPRILSNFMGDRGNQFTLGTFTSCFLFCLLVMRTINSAEDAIFVPHVAVFVGLLFAILGIGVLIYYIHHISESIHISHVIASIGKELQDALDETAKSAKSSQKDHSPYGIDPPLMDVETIANFFPVRCSHQGYIRAVDIEGLVEIATKNDLMLILLAEPGRFSLKQDASVLASPEKNLTPELSKEIDNCFSTGIDRTASQDPLFLVDELVEIAARALSPGINDPFTAISCINWLSCAIVQSANIKLTPLYRFTPDNRLCLLQARYTTLTLIDSTFARLRPYFCQDRNATLHLFAVFRNLLVHFHGCERETELILSHAQDLHDTCLKYLDAVEHDLIHNTLKLLHQVKQNPQRTYEIDLAPLMAYP